MNRLSIASNWEVAPVGPDPDRCKCGAGPHPTDPYRCARGHGWKHNGLRVTTGAYSVARTRVQTPIRQELRAGLLAQKARTEADVEPALSIVLDRLAEAALLATAYFDFISQSGGPLTSKGRTMRAVDGWGKADRCAKFAAMVGLTRDAAPVETFDHLLARISSERARAADTPAADVASSMGSHTDRVHSPDDHDDHHDDHHTDTSDARQEAHEGDHAEE